MNNLDILKKNQDALLLAEAVGWLHDYYKCSEELLQNQAVNRKNVDQSGEYCLKNFILELEKNFKDIFLTFPNGHLLLSSSIYILVSAYFYRSSLKAEIFDNSKKLSKNEMKNKLTEYLFRCHRSSHFDKQEPAGGEQSYPGTKISSPFGFERGVPESLTERLWGLPWEKLKNVLRVPAKV